MACFLPLSRLNRDLKEVQTLLLEPDLEQPPVYCFPRGEGELDHLEALIMGPPGTPYEHTPLMLEIRVGPSYPDKPPLVWCHPASTAGGKVRLNPNLYAGGKVCLSVLGTWTGESADEWRSSYSILYVLRVIQSLILTAVPYHNEPGFEVGSTRASQEQIPAYTAKIRHECLRVNVCALLEEALLGSNRHSLSPQFQDICKQQFLCWYPQHLETARKQLELYPDGTEFQMMPFEVDENCAKGRFQYSKLIDRLQTLWSHLQTETERWRQAGVELTKAQTGLKYLRLLSEADRFKKGTTGLNGVSAGPVSETNNLFVWEGTIVGPEGSAWEGGLFLVEIVFPGQDEAPRVRFQTKMWHPQISTEGIPLLAVNEQLASKEPVVPILAALQKMLAVPPLPSSAAWLNPEAAAHCFHKEEENRRLYKKEVARCVRRSVEG